MGEIFYRQKGALFARQRISACVEEEVMQVKKTVSREALVKEAAFWTALKKAARENPGKICHK